MLPGRSGISWPATATPVAPIGTRTASDVRRAFISSRTPARMCSTFCGEDSVGLSRISPRTAVMSSLTVAV